MEVNNTQTEAGENLNTETPSVTDLDSLSTFRFQGSEYTPDKLLSIVNEHKKLSESAQSRAQREELDAHFEVDRMKLLKDPSLADQFRQKYPSEYHWFLEVLPKEQRPDANPSPTAQNGLPQEILKELEDLKSWKSTQEKRAFDAEVKNAQAHIDKVTEPLFKKFPFAEETGVFAKAEALISNGTKLTEAVWERLIRENHELMQRRFDQHQGTLLKQQTEKGRRAADMGPGGATPGQAPQRPKTFAEAREALMKHVEANG